MHKVYLVWVRPEEGMAFVEKVCASRDAAHRWIRTISSGFIWIEEWNVFGADSL